MAKFDRDGTLLWQQNLNGTANIFDEACSVAVDNQGNVLAAGRTENTGTGSDFTVAKFDRDGTLLWQQNLNGTANGSDEAFSVAVDNQGDVLAAGRTQNTGIDDDFTVAKFDRNGPLLWQQTLNGTANGLLKRRSRWRWTTKATCSPPAAPKIPALRLHGSEVRPRWDPALAAEPQRNGQQLVTGALGGGGQPRKRARRRRHRNTGTWDFTVAKFAADGTLLWQQNLNGTADVSDSGFPWRWTTKATCSPPATPRIPAPSQTSR